MYFKKYHCSITDKFCTANFPQQSGKKPKLLAPPALAVLDLAASSKQDNTCTYYLVIDPLPLVLQ